MKVDFARQQMVEQQIRAWDVLDQRVLDVFSDTPREHYVPTAFAELAFADTEVPLGHGEKMMTPTHEGRMLQALQIEPGDRVLEIGTGSGFVTACLAQLGQSVVSIDIYADFIEAAKLKLDQARFDNVDLIEMDAMHELPEGAFDVVAVTGSVEKFDPRFVEALAPGGRLFIVVGKGPAMDAKIVTRSAEHDWHGESVFETSLKPLVNGSLPPQFAF